MEIFKTSRNNDDTNELNVLTNIEIQRTSPICKPTLQALVDFFSESAKPVKGCDTFNEDVEVFEAEISSIYETLVYICNHVESIEDMMITGEDFIISVSADRPTQLFTITVPDLRLRISVSNDLHGFLSQGKILRNKDI